MTSPPDHPLTTCIIGAAIGDALGLPYEGLSRSRAAKLFGPPDRHRFLFRRGMVSDDTEHTCLVAQALIRSAGDGDLFERELARRLRWWFLALPAGVGLATAKACIRLWCGFSPQSSGVDSAGNGPAMRSAVLGVFAHDLEELKQLVRRSTRITHTDPKAEYGALAVALAAYHAQRSRCVAPQEYLSSLTTLLSSEDAGAFVDLIGRAVRSVEQDESTSEFAAHLGLPAGVGGYVDHCIPVIIHGWLSHQGDYRKALISIIECGGDADTNAAIVGGICGAHSGVDAIPVEWRERYCDWPISLSFLRTLGDQAARVRDTRNRERPLAVRFPAALLRNGVFLAIVLAHGLRRLFPPY